ncbi:MAG: gamma carbonic anhydrase family protein [Verrucomicrobia bacterium]|nr:gamma carbonic anhydrase family protein [Verrucomicrobiota bacterium]
MKSFLLPAENPVIHPDAFIATGAVVIGAVTIGEGASFWFQCVARGDINRIQIGPRSNIQDGTIIHVSDDFPAVIGADVSVGHRAIIHACEIGNGTLVGMGAIVMDGVVIGPRCVIGAGALVTKGTVVPEGSLVLGSPARVVRKLTNEEMAQNMSLAAKYVEVARRYRELGR